MEQSLDLLLPTVPSLITETLEDRSVSPAVAVPIAIDMPKDVRSGKAVLLTHGAGGSLATPGLAALGRSIAGHGHVAVRFDMTYRALGRKSPPKAERAVEGLASIFEQAVATLGPDLAWVVGGRSYGGRVASLAVSEGLQAAGLLLYSYPLHRPGDPGAPRADHFPRIAVPALFLEGTADPFCDLGVLNRSLPLLQGGFELIEVEGGDHTLKVSSSRSPTGQSRSELQVMEDLGPRIGAWLSALS